MRLAEEFDDILDGYFPLSRSIADLLRRQGLTAARLGLTFAPVIAVDGLAPDAPVPLNIQSGRAGMIDHADLRVFRDGTTVRILGSARWQWLDGSAVGEALDPMIRLAEPAIVSIRRIDASQRDQISLPTRIATVR